MDYTLVLLIFVFDVLTGTGAPLEEEQIKSKEEEEEQFKSKVEEYANLLIVRLSQNFQVLFGVLFIEHRFWNSIYVNPVF